MNSTEVRREKTRLYSLLTSALREGLQRISPDVCLDAKGYVSNVRDNLLPGINREDIERDFAAGAGGELETKMRAPWSSSALAVNSFARWRSVPGFQIGGLKGLHCDFAFEAKCPNGVSTIPPHLDVLLDTGTAVVAVESKCCEPFNPRGKSSQVSNKYLSLHEKNDARASSHWFGALSQVSNFQFLDAYQLVKHYLGLRRTYGPRPTTLVYLYWEPVNAEGEGFELYRREIAEFAALVEGDTSCSFISLSYGDHWRELEQLPNLPEWANEHLVNLRTRYLVKTAEA